MKNSIIKRSFFFLLLMFFSLALYSQQDDVKVLRSSAYKDGTKYSTLKFAQKNGDNGVVIVRSYHTGMPSVYHDYMLEVYDKDLKLKKSQKFEFGTSHFSAYNDKMILGFFIKNHVINLITLEYNKESKEYDCLAYVGAVELLDFKKSKLFSINKAELRSQASLSGYETSYTELYKNLFFNEDQSAFCVILDIKKDKEYGKRIQMFDSDFNSIYQHVTTKRAKEFNYNIFDVKFTNDKQLYLLSSVISENSEQKKKYGESFYQVLKFSPDAEEVSSQTIDWKNGEMILPKLLVNTNEVYCVGLYADENYKYQGYSFYSFDAKTLATIVSNSYKSFPESFIEKQDMSKKKINYLYEKFMINKLGFLSNGNLYMVFENRSFKDDGYSFAGKINVFVFSKQGELQKESVFSKGQSDFRTNAYGYYSFTPFQKNDMLYFVTNFQDFGLKDDDGKTVHMLRLFEKSSLVMVKYDLISNEFTTKEIIKNSDYKEIARANGGIVCDNSIFLLGGIKVDRTLYELVF